MVNRMWIAILKP